MRLADIQWGDDSAEKDPFLLEYFVTSDAFGRVRNRTKNIVVGRKGSGKSALRKKLEEDFKAAPDTLVVNLSPKYNAIKNVLNDRDITRNYGEEIFFQHTWLRQILLDSLCVAGDNAKGHYAEDSLEFARSVALQLNRTSKDFVENVADILSKVKGKAGSLGEFGVHIERELRAIADADSLEYHMLRIAQSGATFVILVDDLDLGWDNSQTANNLLLGLLTATNYLSGKSHNIFPCIFLREDVYSILIAQTQHSDKYRNIERIRWEKDDLLRILEENGSTSTVRRMSSSPRRMLSRRFSPAQWEPAIQTTGLSSALWADRESSSSSRATTPNQRHPINQMLNRSKSPKPPIQHGNLMTFAQSIPTNTPGSSRSSRTGKRSFLDTNTTLSVTRSRRCYCRWQPTWNSMSHGGIKLRRQPI